jgi:hypothetical protein
VDAAGANHSARNAETEYLRLAVSRVVLNVGAMEPRNVEYLNGDRFDLRAANLRLIDA